jgi:hypothetical protein
VALLKLIVVIILSYFVSGWIGDLVTASARSDVGGIIAQIVSFFVLLYVFYKLVDAFTKH